MNHFKFSFKTSFASERARTRARLTPQWGWGTISKIGDFFSTPPIFPTPHHCNLPWTSLESSLRSWALRHPWASIRQVSPTKAVAVRGLERGHWSNYIAASFWSIGVFLHWEVSCKVIYPGGWFFVLQLETPLLLFSSTQNIFGDVEG